MKCQSCDADILALDLVIPQLSLTETVGGGTVPIHTYRLCCFAKCVCGLGYVITADVTNIYAAVGG